MLTSILLLVVQESNSPKARKGRYLEVILKCGPQVSSISAENVGTTPVLLK